jgi:hypothetical protein
MIHLNVTPSIAVRSFDDKLVQGSKKARSHHAAPIIGGGRMTTSHPLDPNFTPGPRDVICARGKMAKMHSGNQRFRAMIQNVLQTYSTECQSKLQKSIVVSQIIDSVRGRDEDDDDASSREGCFVKQQGDVWYDVGDMVAREKVGQALRDQLHTHYKSSTKAKRSRRQQVHQHQLDSDLETILVQFSTVSERVQELDQQVRQRDKADNDEMLELFNIANADILAAIKTDSNLQEKVKEMDMNM